MIFLPTFEHFDDCYVISYLTLWGECDFFASFWLTDTGGGALNLLTNLKVFFLPLNN